MADVDSMQLVMMGNGPFALPTFLRLLDGPYRVALLVAQPPRVGHGRKAHQESPLVAEARARELDVFQPDDINAPDSVARVAAVGADLLVVADYGQILSPAALGAARLGGINLHGSLLPKYRGAAPINWALWHGEKETGVSIIHMTPQLDAGPVLAQARLAIGSTETASELEPRLAQLGAELVAETIERLARGAANSLPQDAALASRARRLRKSDGAVDWHRSALEIANQVRALEPWPKAFTYWLRPTGDPLRLILGPVAVAVPAALGEAASATTAVPGQVIRAENGTLNVATGSGALAIFAAQPEGKRMLGTAELLRGYPIRVGQKFGPCVQAG